jgi:cell division protein FtsB
MLMRFRRFDFLVTLGCLALLGYFAWHGFKGPRGYAYLDALVAEAAGLQAELLEEEVAKAELESKASLMRPEKVDPDMLEELARTQLEMSRRNELVVRVSN